MSEQDPNPTTEGQAPPVATPPAPPSDKTPDWYEKELSKTRDEAAKYRTRLREAETKFTGAKTPEEHAAALADMVATNKKLERELLVTKVGKALPDELAALLKGDTEAELVAHAAVLMKYAPAKGDPPPTPPTKLAGGLDATGKGDGDDPKEIARQMRARMR